MPARKTLKIFLKASLPICSLAPVAQAGVLAFTDVKGYEACLRTERLVETSRTDGGFRSRPLSRADVIAECVAAAVKLAKSGATRQLILELVTTTKRVTVGENALDLIAVLVSAHRTACNEMEVYEVILQALSRPSEAAADSVFQKGRKAARVCLQNPDYRRDFLEERDSANSHLRAGACELLREFGLADACPRKGQS